MRSSDCNALLGSWWSRLHHVNIRRGEIVVVLANVIEVRLAVSMTLRWWHRVRRLPRASRPPAPLDPSVLRDDGTWVQG